MTIKFKSSMRKQPESCRIVSLATREARWTVSLAVPPEVWTARTVPPPDNRLVGDVEGILGSPVDRVEPLVSFKKQ